MTAAWRFGSTVCLMGGALTLSALAYYRKPQPLAAPIASIDTEIAGWNGTDDPPLAERIEASLAATTYLSRTYRRGDRSMDLFIAYYQHQRSGESMHSPKYCLPGTGWEMIDSGDVTIPVEGGPVKINNYTLYKPGEQVRILYWYQGAYRTIANEYMTKLYLVWDALRYGHTGGSIVRISLGSEPLAFEEGVKFAGEIVRRIRTCFGVAPVDRP